MTEKAEQVALFKRAQFNEITRNLMWSYPISGGRNVMEAISLKAQGAKPGIPDIFLAYPASGYHGLFIELKVGKGKATTLQVEMIERLVQSGYKALVIYGWERAWSVIEKYLEGTIDKYLEESKQ